MTPGPKTAKRLRRKPGLWPLSAPPSDGASGRAAGGWLGRVSVGFVPGIPSRNSCSCRVACPRKTRLASYLGVLRQFRRRPTVDGRQLKMEGEIRREGFLDAVVPSRRRPGSKRSGCGESGGANTVRGWMAEDGSQRPPAEEERGATDWVSVAFLRGDGGASDTGESPWRQLRERAEKIPGDKKHDPELAGFCHRVVASRSTI
jgi:hypothetical protein